LTRFRRRRFLLWIGIASPILAYVSVGVAALTWPGFDHATQYISELGGEAAPHPAIFNVGVLVSGAGAGVAGIGFALSVLALGGARISAAIIALCFGLAGVGLVLSSLYPWPDPRHLGLGIQIAPLAMVWALRRIEGMGRLRIFLLAVFVVMAILTVLTKHLIFKGLVNDDNVGWWERAFAIVLVGWTGIAAYALERRLLIMAKAESEA
jgi:glucan biosynthesis protein C